MLDFSTFFSNIIRLLYDDIDKPEKRLYGKRIVQEIDIVKNISRLVPQSYEVKAPWIRVDFKPDLSNETLESYSNSLLKETQDFQDFQHHEGSPVLLLPKFLLDFRGAQAPLNSVKFPFERLPPQSPEAAAAPTGLSRRLPDLLPPKLPEPPDPLHTREQSDFYSSIAAVQRLSSLTLMSRRKETIAWITMTSAFVLRRWRLDSILGIILSLHILLTFQALLGTNLLLLRRVMFRLV